MKHISNASSKAMIVSTVVVSSWFVLFSGNTRADFKDDANNGANLGGTDPTVDDSAENIFARITSLLLFLIGAVSVIMIIVGGIRFIVSRGDPQAAASARNTVMYAVVGLVVAVTAYALVSFVIGQIYGTDTSLDPAPATPDLEAGEQQRL